MKTTEITMKITGYGQYSIVATFEHNKKSHTTSKHSTDSKLFDEITELKNEGNYNEIQEKLEAIMSEQINEKIEELDFFAE